MNDRAGSRNNDVHGVSEIVLPYPSVCLFWGKDQCFYVFDSHFSWSL